MKNSAEQHLNQQALSKQNAADFIRQLYQAVDNKNIEFLQQYLAENIRFRIGNNPVNQDKTAILKANQDFFASIQSMAHSIEEVIVQGDNKTTKASCFGRVDYVRLDGTQHSAVFATYLQLENEQITDYLVFADLSGL